MSLCFYVHHQSSLVGVTNDITHYEMRDGASSTHYSASANLTSFPSRSPFGISLVHSNKCDSGSDDNFPPQTASWRNNLVGS